MKRICLDTMITLFYQSRRRSADKVKDICKGIFVAYRLNINMMLSILVDTFISKISLPMQPDPEIGSISDA